jgi:hypothetical protein
MTGHENISAQGLRLVEQRPELDPLVAPDTRVRGLARGVRIMEVADHGVFERLGEVQAIERDAERVGDPPCILRRVDVAAAGRVVLGLAAPQLQHDAGHVIAGIDHQRSGHGRIHAAGHRH